MLGGTNDLLNATYIENMDDEKIIEYNNFFDLINYEEEKKELYIPKYCSDSNNHLSNLAYMGLSKRLDGKITNVYKTRLDYELSVIKEMGFIDYFLIVYDYVLYAKKNNIMVGPGRGSAAGSLVCYSIGITDIDPIKYDLLFERFLNIDRITMPDIDIDFDSLKREDIITYVRNKYGNHKVAVGSTYNTLKTRLVLNEVSKLLNIDSYLMNKFLKNIDRNKSLEDNKTNETIKKYLSTYKELNNLYDISLKLENLKKNVSTHAAGVVICSKDIDEIIPVFINDDIYKTGVPMEFLEDLGILKMDFLGVKNLTTISNIINEVNVNLNDIDYNDKKVIELFSNANTDGIFQYETYAMKNLLKKLKPTNFDEVIAAMALVRPGPNEFLDDYIYNKNNKDKITYLKNLEPILKDTYGIILYQEQIIKILNVVGNFTNSEADNIRRAISKKKLDIVNSSKELFMKNAILNGYSNIDADNLFRKILRFANYGFNKSHSVAYAIIGYRMAYLKVYYEEYFIKELLGDLKDKNVLINYFNSLKEKNISILKPDINYSKDNFYIKNNKLMLPLTLINGITKNISDDIILNAPYKDIFDFVLLNKNIGKDITSNLIKSSALRSLSCNINTLLNTLDSAYIYSELSGFGEKPIIKEYEELDQNTLSLYEYSMYGFYISNHPSSKYNDSSITKLKNKEDNLFKNIKLVVKIENIKSIKTKKGDDMAFILVSDDTKSDDIVVFSDNYNKLNSINKNDLVTITGRVSKNKDKVNIVLDTIKKINI